MTLRELTRGWSEEQRREAASILAEHLVKWFWYGFWIGGAVGLAAGVILKYVVG